MDNVLADDMKIEAYGQVTPPPDLAEIVRRIGQAATSKDFMVVSPGELRVLADHFASCH